MILKNSLIEKYNEGKIILGCQLRSHSSVVAEVLCSTGIDFVFIDNEHFPANPETNEELIRTIQGMGIMAILRIPGLSASNVLQYLDAGANGLIAPHIDSYEDALEFVNAGKYQPMGNRGFSNGSRASNYGNIPIKEYKEMANANTWLMPMIESYEAVENLDAILKSGIDAIHIGQMDLSESMGFGGDQTEEVQKAIDLIIQKAKRARIPIAYSAYSPELAIEMIHRGVDMITMSSDLMTLSAALKSNFSKLNQFLSSK